MDQPSVYHIKTPQGADKALLCAKSEVLIETGTGKVFNRCSFANSGELSFSAYMQTYPTPVYAFTSKYWACIYTMPIVKFLAIDNVPDVDRKPIQPSLDRLTSYVRRGVAYQRKRAVYMAFHPLLIRHAPIGRLDAETIELIIRLAL
jgi:hypothetical protein